MVALSQLLTLLGSALCALALHRNPILPGFSADPSILVVGDDHFITTSSFEFFPGHPIYHSKDLIDWKLIGHALNRPSQLPMMGLAPEGGAWAPTLRYYDGVYYMFTAVRWVYTTELRQQSRSFYVTTTDIFSDQWSDPIWIDVLGYDTDLFVDGDGTAYATRCSINNATAKIYGIYQSQIDLDTGRVLSPDALIFNGTLPLNSTARPEGPHVYKKGDYYYLLIAEGGSSVYHRATVQRGPSPSGPWEDCPHNPLIYNGVDSSPKTQPVQMTGHADWAQLADGSWWGVLLGVRPQGGELARSQLGRETFLFPIEWEDDWPVFNKNKSIGLTVEGNPPAPSGHNVSLPSFYDDFSSTLLDKSYRWMRTPYLTFWSLLERPGWMRIFGGAISLGDRDLPSLLLRRQEALNTWFETELEFYPNTAKEEAGLTVFYNDFYHDEVGISRCPPSISSSNTSSSSLLPPARCVFHRQIVSTNATSTSPVVLANATTTSLVYSRPLPFELDQRSVRLVIQAEPTRYSFGYQVPGAGNSSAVEWLGVVDSRWLYSAPSGYFLFKGVHVGIYSQGGGVNMAGNPADFKYWEQRAVKDDPLQ